MPPPTLEFDILVPENPTNATLLGPTVEAARAELAAASAQHGSILHCALRSQQQSQSDASATKKLAKTAQPHKFCFVFASNDKELLELVSLNLEQNKKKPAAAEEGAASAAATTVDESNNIKVCYALASSTAPSAETVLALVEKLQIPQEGSSVIMAPPPPPPSSSSSGVAAPAAAAASGNGSGGGGILVALPPDRTSPCWLIEAPTSPTTPPPPSLADRMWTACLQSTGLNLLVGFWYGSQSGNAEYICTQLHHLFTNERGAKQGTPIKDYIKRSQAAVAATTSAGARALPNAALAGCGSLVLLDTLNSFAKKDMLSDAVLQRYVCVHIFVCSTHGDGDFPDNASRVKKYLSTKCAQNKTALASQSLFFSVLALGDTNYSKFCEAGKLLNRKLKELGATCILPIRTADDGIGLELVVDPYLEAEVWPPLEKQLGTLLKTVMSAGTPLSSPLLAAGATSAAAGKGGARKSAFDDILEVESSSSPQQANKGAVGAVSSRFDEANKLSDCNYMVSSLILYSPSALTHAGVLQSVLVNAGMHDAGSLPMLLPLRLLFDGGDKFIDEKKRVEKQGQKGSNSNAGPDDATDAASPMSPFAQKLAQNMLYQRVPAAKSLFVLTSSDAAWWDDTTTTGEEHKHHRVCEHISQVCSNVKVFAYFDIDQSLSKGLERSRVAAMSAFHLPKKKLDSFDYLQVQQEHFKDSTSSTPEFHCGFTSWLRSLARWLVPRTIGKAASLKVTDAVLSVVDSVVHGHHDRGLFVPVLDADSINTGGASSAALTVDGVTYSTDSAAAAVGGGGVMMEQHFSSSSMDLLNRGVSFTARGEALHILSLKRTVVLFSRTTIEEQLHSQQQQQQQLLPQLQQQQPLLDPALRGQSLAEDVARGVATSVLHGLDVDAAEIGHFKQAGFPRKAVFVFVLGPDTSKGVRRLIDHINGMLVAARGGGGSSKFPLSGMSFAIFAIEWVTRQVQDYGGALELELVLQEAGATKVHPTGLARTGAIDPVLSKWRRSLKRSVETCNQTTGYIEPAAAPAAPEPPSQQKKQRTPPIVPRPAGSAVGPLDSRGGDMARSREMSHLALSPDAPAGSSISSSAAAMNPLIEHNPLTMMNQQPLRSNTSITSATQPEDDDDEDDYFYNSEAEGGQQKEYTMMRHRRSSAAAAGAHDAERFVSVMASQTWEQYLSVRPTPAALTARTDLSIVVTLSSTGFSNIVARRCANEARILGYNIVFVGTVSRAEEFLGLPTSCVVLVCGTKPPRRLVNGLGRLSRGRADVLSHLSFACLGVSSMSLAAMALHTSGNVGSVPGAQLSLALEKDCGAQRVFPSAVVDSPSAAETKGVLWLRGALGSLARVVARKSFLRSQGLSSLPALTVNNTNDAAGDKKKQQQPSQQNQEEEAQTLLKRRIVFFHCSTPLTESMVRDMAEEASARNFHARQLPITSFKEIVVASTSSDGSIETSIAASCIVLVCDETSSVAVRSLFKIAGALARTDLFSSKGGSDSGVNKKHPSTAFGVLAVVDRRRKMEAVGASAEQSPSKALSSTLERVFPTVLCPRAAVDISDPGCVPATNTFREDLFVQSIKHVSTLLRDDSSARSPANKFPETSAKNPAADDLASDAAAAAAAAAQDLEKSPSSSGAMESTTAVASSAAEQSTHEDGGAAGGGTFVGRIVETYPLTSEVTNPPVIFALFEVFHAKQQQQQKLQRPITWTPGDAIQILPENDPREVDAILSMLQLRGDEPFLPPWDPSVKDSKFPSAPVYRQINFPQQQQQQQGSAPVVTVREVLLRHLSLKVHNKEVCNMMERFVTDPQHRAVLRLVSAGGGSAIAALSPVSPGGGAAAASSPAGSPSSAGGVGGGSNASSPASSSSPAGSAFAPSSSSRRDIYLVDVLQRIRESVRLIPFRGFVETLPALQARSYSITTAPLAHQNHIGIAFKVAPRGVCTNWLLRMCELASEQRTVVEIPIKMRPAPEFRMPKQVETPMILIGPGTGVAPFLSFLAHREALMLTASNEGGKEGGKMLVTQPQQEEKDANNSNDAAMGDIHLYFGCRSKYHDFLFQEELEAWKRGGVLAGLHTAFSQDSNGGAWFGGLYVQDLLRESGPDLCRMVLEQNGHVYVCGDAGSMARDVHQVLVDILVEFRGLSTSQAAAKLKEMENAGAYQRDIW